MNTSNLQDENCIFRKVVESHFIFLTTPDEVEKHVEIMHSNFSDKSIHHYHIQILNHFDPELKLITVNL